MYYERHIHSVLKTLMQQFPAVLVTGPRQVGKSTLLRHIAPDYEYVSLDDPLLLSQAKDEPGLLLLNFPENIVLDEAQYAPELFPVLKMAIDGKQRNGLFLLSGSQAFELMKNVSETLAGRIAIAKLSGLSLREIQQNSFDWPFIPSMDYLQKRETQLQEAHSIWEIIHRGSMPRMHKQEIDWHTYYASYTVTYIERDVRQIVNIESSLDFTKFMVAIAARSGELLNYRSVAQDVGVSVETVNRWVTILQTSGVVYLLQPYGSNHLKRAIKTPKLYMLDTGLMAWLSRWLTPETIEHGAKSGQFLETFVVSEIIKSFYNRGQEPPLYFYRDTNQKEIDILIEHGQTLYPVEIKSTTKPDKRMAGAFALLRSQLPQGETRVAHGTIICCYPRKLWLADNLVSIPLSYL